MPGHQHAVTVAAPPERVWEVLADVERWPERIPTVDAVERLDAGPLAVGSRTRLQQPKLPEAVWTVTELDEGRSFTWESRSRGVAISGPLAPVGWLMTKGLTRRYVETEAASIQRIAEAGSG